MVPDYEKSRLSLMEVSRSIGSQFPIKFDYIKEGFNHSKEYTILSLAKDRRESEVCALRK